jgi:hypothetical protein
MTQEWPNMPGVEDHPDRELTIDRENLPSMPTRLYRKRGLTLMMGPIDATPERPVTVVTVGGPIILTEHFMLALDTSAYPYPVAMSVLHDSYDEVEQGEDG